MTLLTIYPTNLASTTITTANQLLANVTGASNITSGTKIGTSTGYGEVYAQGHGANWTAAGSVGAPSGHGWLLDSTLLEGSSILAGSWTPSVRGSLSSGTITANIILRFYAYHLGGTYTGIGTATLAAQTFTTSLTEYPFAAASFGATSFVTGDKLYTDAWLDITANGTGNTSATINWSMANSSTLGSTQVMTATPGYFVVGAASTQSNSVLAETAQVASPVPMVANAALSQWAQIFANATMQSNSTLVVSAALNANAVAVSANAVMSATGMVTGHIPQGVVTELTVPTGATTQPLVPRDISPLGASIISRPTGESTIR